ncbi:hypothetical protein PMI07_000833 [Rhizobium sp. CF080]|nr:hypothetical protein PMI07_000833 [Rhizobium sp. CF080]
MRFTDQFLDDLRERVSISDVVGTRVTWERSKTRPQRGDYWGCCPFHGESRPSFHCEDKKGRYHCFGCGASGNHFKFFMDLDGVTFPRAVEIVASLAGVSLPGSEETADEKRERMKREADRARRNVQKEADDRREQERKAESVRSIWEGGVAIAGTLAETYLRTRSIELADFPAGMAWMPSLRFHSRLKLGTERHPALIGGVQSKSRKLVAVWRIFLGPDGKAISDKEGKKVKLGFGPATGGAVRLGPVTETLRLTEGIETGLGVMLLTKPNASTWATLSTSGMMNFEIPEGVKRLEIYADGDRHRLNNKTGDLMEPPGIVAAKKLQERARQEGVEAVVHPSPEPDDWLDVWVQRKKDEQRISHYR